MWHYNGEDDASRCGRKGSDNFVALAAMLADLCKGEKEDFTRLKCREGFSMYNPPSWVSFCFVTLLNPLPESHLVELNPTMFNRNGGRLSRGYISLLRSWRTILETWIPDLKRIQIYS